MLTTAAPEDVTARVNDYMPLAYALARRFGTNAPWLLDDLRSEAGFALWRAARTYRPGKAKFATWARRLICFACAVRMKRERIQNCAVFREQSELNSGKEIDPLQLIANRDAPPDAAIEHEDEVAALGKMLNALPADRRAMLVRHIGHGVHLETLGAEIGTTRSNAGARIHRDLRRLKQLAQA